MAALTRRKWSDIETEVNRRIGGQFYSGMAARIQQAIQEAYFQFATVYNHYELQESVLQTLTEGSSLMDMPEEAFSILTIAEVDVDQEAVLVLQNRNEIVRKGLFNPTAGAPDSYARSGQGGRSIQFNRATDSDRRYQIDYYRLPDRIDFVATVEPDCYSELNEIFDSVLIDLAQARIGGILRSSDIEAYGRSLAEAYLGQQQVPPVLEEPTGDLSDTVLTNRPRGGLRG